jgi:8-hydroxy-5-deazaflavin:NADPH oxidoreductase
MQIGVLGGTGPAGRGMAARLADAGHTVIAGSRHRARAERVVTELRERWDGRVATLTAGTNAEAADARDLVVVATNWEAALDTTRAHAAQLTGKIVLAMANGLQRDGKEFRSVLPDAGSIAAAMQALAPGARVAAAMQHVPAHALEDLEGPLESDVVVCADDDEARRTVIDVVGGIPGLRAFDGGSLANAAGVEAFAAVLLTVNLRHGGTGTLRLHGVEPTPR